MRRYSVLLLPESETEGYSVVVPVLPGCSSQGNTVGEALANAREAILRHLQAMAADGTPIPEERGKPKLFAVEVFPDNLDDEAQRQARFRRALKEAGVEVHWPTGTASARSGRRPITLQAPPLSAQIVDERR